MLIIALRGSLARAMIATSAGERPQPAEVAPARESRCAAALPALVLPLDPLSEATPPTNRYPQGENPSALGGTGEGAATHGPRVVLVTWPGTVQALSCRANPGRRIGRIPDSAGSAPVLADSHRVARGSDEVGRAEPRKVETGLAPGLHSA